MQLTTRRARGYDVRTRSRIAGLGEDVVYPADFVGPIPDTGPIGPTFELNTPADYVNFFQGPQPSPAATPPFAPPSFFEQVGSFLRNVVTPAVQAGAPLINRTGGARPLTPYTPGSSLFPSYPAPAAATLNPMLILGIGATVILIATMATQRRK